MLPGFKILIATIVLSVSVLIFGLGAAALLRSAHDEFVSIPSWRAAQQPMMAPALDSRRLDTASLDSSRPDTTRPTLSLLRAEPIVTPSVATKEKIDDGKVASIDPQTLTDAKPDVAANVVEEAKPAIRKRRASAKRKRIVRRARTTVAAQQQTIGSDPFGSFGNSLPLATPPRR